MSDEDLICLCMSVSRGEIIQAIEKGATSFDALKETLYCGTGCGTCEGRVQKIIDEKIKGSANPLVANLDKKTG